MDIYRIRGDSYQAAHDLLCHTVQTLDTFAWCRPLMDPRDLEPRGHVRSIGNVFPHSAALAVERALGLSPVAAMSLLAGERIIDRAAFERVREVLAKEGITSVTFEA